MTEKISSTRDLKLWDSAFIRSQEAEARRQ